nr:hypothetical protein [uncultured Rhodopila sp.]
MHESRSAVESDRPSSSPGSQATDAETRMRLSLGLGTAPNSAAAAPVSTDPLKGARQAIRSQAAAREYVERQLIHAESTIQDLRGKLHHARQEKDAAVEAARFAAAAKQTIQRTLMVTEASLTTEKAARDRAERALREAQATINHLQAASAAAAQGVETLTADLETERQGRRRAETALREALAARSSYTIADPGYAPAVPVKRPVGRPRKTPLVQSAPIPVQAPVKVWTPPAEETQASTRSSGRTASAAQPKTRNPDNQKPVEWWVQGWNRRSK